jgi:hypothetical protein
MPDDKHAVNVPVFAAGNIGVESRERFGVEADGFRFYWLSVER